MTYPAQYFLSRRGLFLGAVSLPLLATPAFANVGPDLLKGTLAKFELASAPKNLPEIDFLDPDDKALKLADYKGKAVLLNFWATWCAPCVKEMPSLDRLQAAMTQEIGKDKFVVVPLSLDGPSKPKVAPFYKDKNLANLGIYFDKGRKVQQALDVSVLPTSILIDGQGRELGRILGEADWDKPESIALMKAAVG
jgi:thiol-disulfide isomerase/thioredoxin